MFGPQPSRGYRAGFFERPILADLSWPPRPLIEGDWFAIRSIRGSACLAVQQGLENPAAILTNSACRLVSVFSSRRRRWILTVVSATLSAAQPGDAADLHDSVARSHQGKKARNEILLAPSRASPCSPGDWSSLWSRDAHPATPQSHQLRCRASALRSPAARFSPCGMAPATQSPLRCRHSRHRGCQSSGCPSAEWKYDSRAALPRRRQQLEPRRD